MTPAVSVARTAGIGLDEVSSALTSMGQQGLVEELPTGWRLTPLAHD